MYAFSEVVERASRRAKPCRSVESKMHVVDALLHLQYDTGSRLGKDEVVGKWRGLPKWGDKKQTRSKQCHHHEVGSHPCKQR